MSAAQPKLAVLPPSPPRLEPSDLLTPEQLAERLQVGVRWVYEVAARKNNPLPVYHAGRYMRIYWPECCAWMRGKVS